MEERNEEIRSFVSFALLERLLSYKTIHILQLISQTTKVALSFIQNALPCRTVPQTHKQTLSLCIYTISPSG